MNYVGKLIKNALIVVSLSGALTNTMASNSFGDHNFMKANYLDTFSTVPNLGLAITSISSPSYDGSAKPAIYNIDARSFIGLIRTNPHHYGMSKFNFLDNAVLSGHNASPILTIPTSDSPSYAMLLSGLSMMAFIARRRRHLI